MNESLERALSQISLLKKTLNSEKTSHQNTLQQLEATYKIIDQIKQLLKNQQEKNKLLTRQLNQKNHKIQQISTDYEDQIISIKELIERKDHQIKKYTQIKVTDYDMIRLRVITEVEAQHHEQIEQLKKQIQKQEFINSENMFQMKVLQQKNLQYAKEIEQLKQSHRLMQQQFQTRYTRQLNKMYGVIEEQKMGRKHLQKKMEREKQMYTETIKKYHKQLQVLQKQLMSQTQNKENSSRYANNPSSNSLIHLKESQFAVQNQKLKRQIKQKTEQLDELTKRHKSQTKQFNKKIDELEKQLIDANYSIKKLHQDIIQNKIALEEEFTQKWKKELQRKLKTLQLNHQQELDSKQTEILTLNRKLQHFKNLSHKENELVPNLSTVSNQKEKSLKLQKQNDELKAQLKKSVLDIVQLRNKLEQEKVENRQTRAVSVEDLKGKLRAANAQIVSLLREKIALNEKIAKMGVKA